MFYIAWALTALIAAAHAWIAWMEIAEWEKPRTRAIFGTDPDFAAESAKLASNVGLYNGMLALGLAIGLFLSPVPGPLVIYLLVWVLAAGLWGAATVSIRIALVQALPAFLALLAWWDA